VQPRGGFDADALRKALDVPDAFALHCLVALGEQGATAVLEEALQARAARTPAGP